MPQLLQTRSAPPGLPQGMQVRAINLSARALPSSIDKEKRRAQFVIATSAPAVVWDWERFEYVEEVLLMGGMQPPENGQCPMIDSHDRSSIKNLLGSYSEFTTEGEKALAWGGFSSVPDGEDAFIKACEGHLTDCSVGYTVDTYVWIESGKTAEVEGKTYQGPLKVSTRWRIKEISLVPIGADQGAKVRAAENTRSKEQTMDPKFRALLEQRGLAKDATEAAAWAFAVKNGLVEIKRGHHREPAGDETPAPAGDGGEGGGGEPATPASAADPSESGEGGEGGERQATQPDTRAIAEQERERAAEIFAMCRANGISDKEAAEMVKSGKDQGRCAMEVLSMSAERQGGGPGYRGARVQADETDKYRAAAGDALMLRGGMPVETPAPGHDELRGYTLKELARECLRRGGQRTGGTDHEMVGRALTSSDLPNILSNVANKSVMLGWDTASQTWQIWIDDSGSVPDFKESTLVRLSEFDDLDQILEDGEYKYAKLSDIKESFKLGSYGKAIHLGRVMIINDDLSMLTSIPQAMGEAAARMVSDVAHAAFISNPNMGDGKALFHADHNNIITITAFDVDGIGAAIQKMTAQKDMKGLRRLNIVPQYFVSPTAFYVTAEKFFGSDVIGTQGEPNVKNPFTGTFKPGNRVYEARLDDDSTTVFYLMGPKGKTVKVFFLNGVKAPFIDFTDDWNTDGRKGKVRIDVGAKALDWRGMVKVTVNAGG